MSVVLLFLYITPAVLAEDPAPPGGSSGPGSTPVGNGTPVGAPIDGGLGILLAMGAAYGGYKAYKRRKESSDEEQQEVQ